MMRKLLLSLAVATGMVLAVLVRTATGRVGLTVVACLCTLALALLPILMPGRRARWADFALILIGLLGFGYGVVGLLIAPPAAPLSPTTLARLRMLRTLAGGMILGLLSALILSRQLLGTRPESVGNAPCRPAVQ